MSAEVLAVHLCRRGSRLIRPIGYWSSSRLRATANIAIDEFAPASRFWRHLRRLPFDKLKIDSAFVRASTRDRRAGDLLIALADRLGIDVLAEGRRDSLAFGRG